MKAPPTNTRPFPWATFQVTPLVWYVARGTAEKATGVSIARAGPVTEIVVAAVRATTAAARSLR